MGVADKEGVKCVLGGIVRINRIAISVGLVEASQACLESFCPGFGESGRGDEQRDGSSPASEHLAASKQIVTVAVSKSQPSIVPKRPARLQGETNSSYDMIRAYLPSLAENGAWGAVVQQVKRRSSRGSRLPTSTKPLFAWFSLALIGLTK